MRGEEIKNQGPEAGTGMHSCDDTMWAVIFILAVARSHSPDTAGVCRAV